MSERHVLTVRELRDFLNAFCDRGEMTYNMPVVIIENDAESVKEMREQYGKGHKGKYIYASHDQIEGLRLCNVGGIVYNAYEHEKALVLGFSHETTFENIIKNGPTKGNTLASTLIDIKKNEPLTFDNASDLNVNPDDISFTTEHK